MPNWVNRVDTVQTDRQTDGRSECDTSSAQYKRTLAARRQTSNNGRSLLVLRAVRRQRRAGYMYVNLAIFELFDCTIVKNISFANKIAESLLNIRLQTYKVVQTPTTCDLQSRLSELLKRLLSKTLTPCEEISTTTPSFWQSCNTIHGIQSVCQARWKCGVPFMSYL